MRVAILLLSVAAHAATLDGTVSNAVTGAPIRKARVTATAGDITYSAVSDPSGRWSIPALPAGSYNVTVVCQGFVPPAARRPPVRVPDDSSVALELAPLSVIAGKVVDEEGDPVPKIALSVLSYDYSRPAPALRSVTMGNTDDRGDFRFFDLKPGRYYVQAMPSDRTRTLAVAFHGGATEILQAAPIDLAPGAEATGTSLVLPKLRTYRVRGTLLDGQTGKPLRAVVFAELGGAPAPRYSAPTAPDGTFTFPALQSGTYWLTVTQNAGPREMNGEHTLLVASRDIDDLQITAAPALDIPGTIIVDGPSRPDALNLRVTLEPALRPGFSTSVLPKNGQFLLTAAPQLQAVQISGMPPDLYLREIRFGAEDASAGRIDLRRGAAPLTLTLASNLGTLAGVVQTAAGKPLAGALVAVTLADPANYRLDLCQTVTTGPEGHFSVSLAPGAYRVFAWDQFDPALAISLDFRRLLAAKATAVAIRAGSEESVRLEPLPQADFVEARRRLP